MKLIVGLGNIGEKYKNTRHNVGFVVIDELEKQKEELGKIKLVKPDTFMNESGKAVAKLVRFYKLDLDNVYVVHDDLDIKLGGYKIQKGVGPKVHNGILSVEKELGDKEFWRVRMGVDNRKGDRRMSGEDYVLGRFRKQEQEVVGEVIKKVVKEIRGKICI